MWQNRVFENEKLRRNSIPSHCRQGLKQVDSSMMWQKICWRSRFICRTITALCENRKENGWFEIQRKGVEMSEVTNSADWTVPVFERTRIKGLCEQWGGLGMYMWVHSSKWNTRPTHHSCCNDVRKRFWWIYSSQCTHTVLEGFQPVCGGRGPNQGKVKLYLYHTVVSDM